MEDEDSDKEVNKKLTDSLKNEINKPTSGQMISDAIFSMKESTQNTENYQESSKDPTEIKEEPHSSIDLGPSDSKNALTPDYTESFFDMAMEVTNKSAKAKRVYSRTKKKEDIDILLAVEKACSSSIDDHDITEETGKYFCIQSSDYLYTGTMLTFHLKNVFKYLVRVVKLLTALDISFILSEWQTYL